MLPVIFQRVGHWALSAIAWPKTLAGIDAHEHHFISRFVMAVNDTALPGDGTG